MAGEHRPGRWLARTATAGAVVLGCAVLWKVDPTVPGGIFPPCPTRALLGFDCPFCGGLRAGHFILHGDIFAALRYNAFALVLLGVGFWLVGAWLRGICTGRADLPRAHLRRLLPVLQAAAAVWFALRILPFAPFSEWRV